MIRTPLLTGRDDIVEVIRKCALPKAQRGDVIAVAETAVAVTQGRYMRPDKVKPGRTARLMARFISQKGSLSSPYAMQVVLQEHGPPRVVAAFLAGALARLLGRSGVFYRLAGPQAALIDDVTGTTPPFDKFIVLGPKDPQAVVKRIKDRSGHEAVIVDANGLGGVSVVAATENVDLKVIVSIFKSNPWGNADELTPIMLIRHQPESRK
ncbi:MAG: coenzyme F420-0:L-glutamate ligase [Firmicutes bacterium]|nr:coenzyme F420-0:L-glutamate ligase [Bacillota bacterium]